MKVSGGSGIALLCGIAAIVMGLGLVVATVHPAIPFLAGGVALLAVGGILLWRGRAR